MTKELDYQNRGQTYIETLLSQWTGITTSILMEEFSHEFDHVLQTDKWIISQSLPQFQLVGLYAKLKEFNHVSIAKTIANLGLNRTVDDVVRAIVEDFSKRFSNASNGYDVYQLIFTPNTLLDATKRRIATVDGVAFDYDVVYYEWMNGLKYQGKNAFSIIREKRIEIPGQGTSHQRPDFAVYINGIPFIFIEYKTEESGLKEAVADLENKSTYRKVPFYVATNGHECAVICNIEQFNIKDSTNTNAYLWKSSQRTPETMDLTDIECFYHEVLCQPEHLYFYATQVTSLDHQRQLVKNGRVQQYQAVKNFHGRLQAMRAQKTRTAANLAVFHTQRSGKTVTMKLMAQLVLNHYNDLFQYIFIYAPDLQIKKVLTDEINAPGGNSLISIDIIGGDSGITFEKALKQMHADQKTATVGVRRIFIVNMQRIKVSKSVPAFTSFNVLNIIDEGHHGQAGELADVRDQVLPNATNVLFTATPKKDTYVHYLGVGSQADANILDRFTFTQAKAADIVVNVLYLKPNTLVDTFKKSGKLAEFLELAEEHLEATFEDQAQLYDAISDYADNPTFANSAKGIFAKGLMQQIHEDILPAKIEQIVDFQKEVKASLTHKGQVLFEPKAIVYTQDIAHAKAYIDTLRALNGGIGNVYQGLRFALDYAALDDATSLIENDGIGVDSLEMAFRRQDPGMRIDVLIAVNKYQKGYDLPELTTVFLDKTVQEPSLINQIYTRPATKRRHKTIGYSIDLTLGSNNRKTFDDSLKLYDDEAQGSSQFITEDAIKGIQKAVDNTLLTLQVQLELNTSTFTKERILQAVLNPPTDAERQPRQAVFFKESKTLFKYIDQLKSPLYFKSQRLEISALYHAFLEFKDIYADTKHPDHSKIKICLDSTLEDAYLTKDEIQTIIANVLGIMQEKSLATLLDFEYSNASDMLANGADGKTLVDWAATQKKEERKTDLLKAIKLTEFFLKERDKTLYELVKALLDKLSTDRTLVYNDDVQSTIIEFLARVSAHQKAFKAELNNKYTGSAFIYYMADSLQKAFPRLDALKMLPFYVHVGAKLNTLYKQTSRNLTHGLTVQEQVKECAKKMVNDPAVKYEFRLAHFLLNNMGSWAGEIRVAFLSAAMTDTEANGYTFEDFKQSSLSGKRLEDVITNVHRLQGHF